MGLLDWTNEEQWRVHQFALYAGMPVAVIGLGLNLIVGVAGAHDNANTALLDVFEVIGWMLIAGGGVLALLFFFTRNAEKPRRFAVRIRTPEPPIRESIRPERMALDAEAWVLRKLRISSESDETVSVEFALRGSGEEYGMYPYREYYTKHRAAMKDRYLSNPRHLGPRQQAEGELPFMADDRMPIPKGEVELVVTITPPGEKQSIKVPTPEDGVLLEGLINK